MSEEKTPGWRSLFGIKPKEENPLPVIPAATTPPFSATPEQMTHLAQAVADLEDRFSALETSLLSTVNDSGETRKAVDELKTAVTEISEQFKRQEVKDLFTKLPDLMQKFSKLDEVITALPTGGPATQQENKTFTIV